MKILKTIFAVLITISILQAEETKKASAEIGWRFGDFQETNTTKAKQDDLKKSEKEILAEMLEIQRKQLKTQQEILSILQKKMDPKPETIIGKDGKPCIANSSANCYKWIPVAEARKYPIIAEFYSNPTIQNAAKYLQWYSVHINHATKAGIALNLARDQYGENAIGYGDFQRPSLMDNFGDARRYANYKLKEDAIKAIGSSIHYKLFIGRSLRADLFGLKGLSVLVNDLKWLKYDIYFLNSDVRNKILALTQKTKAIKMVLDHANNQVVSKVAFKTYGIYATPSLVMQYKDKDPQIIMVGRTSRTDLLTKIYRYLEFNNVIKPTDTIDYKVFDKSDYALDNARPLLFLKMSKKELLKYDYDYGKELKPFKLNNK